VEINYVNIYSTKIIKKVYKKINLLICSRREQGKSFFLIYFAKVFYDVIIFIAKKRIN